MAKVVDRRLLVLPAVALVVAALLGYIAGRGHARALPHEQTRTTSIGAALLELPARWRAASRPQLIPGLAIHGAVALAPGGDSSGAGLIAGSLPAGQASPLPRAFVSRMRRLPSTSAVSLQETQAYRYGAIDIPGLAQTLTVYVVPSPGAGPTALVCYASAAHSADLQACERAVATLTLTGQSQSYDLIPQPEYAQKLSALIASLDATRAGLRGAMSGHVSPAGMQRLAGTVAAAFANAAATLAGLEPTVATGQAQAELSSAILKAREAYAALASAAGQRSESRFAAARTGVEAAEAGVSSALETFVLLGYKPA